MIRILFLLSVLSSSFVFSQSDMEIRVVANNEEVQLGKTFSLEGKSYRLDLVKFYITNICLLNNGTIVADYSDTPQLINLEEDSTTVIHLNRVLPLVFNEIKFTFGVDSLTNVSGIMDGALDPVNGMYWSWQSGFINCKIEGEILGENTKNVAYHLGGYLPHQLAAKTIVLPVENNSLPTIEFNLDAILLNLGHKDLFQIMSPGENAVIASELLAHTIKTVKK